MRRSIKGSAGNRLAVIAAQKTTARASVLMSAVNAPVNVMLGVPYWLPITVSNAQQFVAMVATLTHDPDRIQIETSDGAVVWEAGSFFPDPVIEANFGTNPGEIAIYAQPSDPDSPGVDGAGEILRIKFTPIATGITKLIWVPDSGLYRPDPDIVLAKIDSLFTPLDLSASGTNATVITLNVIPA